MQIIRRISPLEVAALLCAGTLLIFVREARAADVDLQPGTSITSAVNAAQPGDRILLHRGNYPGGGWIGPVHGTESAPITIVSVDGPRATVISGGGEALRIGDASSYLVFDGIEVTGSGDNAIHIDGQSNHITLRNVYAHDAGIDGDVLKVNQCDHIVVEHSEFARPGPRTTDAADNPYQECIDFVHVNDSVVRDSFIHDGGSMLEFVKGGSRNVVLERNVYAGQRDGASDPSVGLGGPTDPWLLGGEQYEVINIIFRNNVIIGGKVGAIAVYDANGGYIANNLLLDNDRVLVEFRAGNGPAGGSTDVRVVNNLMVDTRGAMPTPYQLSSHTLTNFTTADNLFWNAGSAIPTSSLLNLAAQPGQMTLDPLVHAAGAITDRATILTAVRPAAGSPAAGSGMDSSAAPFFVTDDIDGTARAGSIDRGPFALGAPTPPPVDAGTPPGSTDAGSMPGTPADAGTPPGSTDAGSMPGTPADAGTIPVARDAGSMPGTRADAGSSSATDAGTANKPGDGGDGGSDPVATPRGCSARSDADAGDLALVIAALAGFVFIARRRRNAR